jgi:hypothetical protein
VAKGEREKRRHEKEGKVKRRLEEAAHPYTGQLNKIGKERREKS